ncbi:hypothetical protein SEEM6152_20050 [Salmonella enterica subsp. enterica serovar Montevideo str. 556152]|nr:hypothetical protein SEEM6152_20050 [Salmonella enterica subsp. enterica serovar Montevideo str. 556152]
MKIVEVKHPLVKHKLGLMRENALALNAFVNSPQK